MDNDNFLYDFWRVVGVEGPRSFYSFETFVINLLKHHTHSHGQKFRTFVADSKYDAIATEGILDIRGRTHIVIKRTVSITYLKRYLETYIFTNEKTPSSTVTLLIITATQVSKDVIDKFKEEFKIYSNATITPIFWGPDEINELIKKDKNIAVDLFKNIFSMRLKNAVEQTSDDWRKEREIIVNDLKLNYKNGQFSLFLGAGVSSSAGMPDWETLLGSLFVSYLSKDTKNASIKTPEDIKELVDRLNKFEDRSALMSARYLRKGFINNVAEDKDFRSVITKTLYELRDNEKGQDSKLITSIANLCMPKRTGAKVQSVYTYNFDDLLEKKLTSLGISFKSIYSGTGNYIPDELPVYHVHGFLPQDPEGHDFIEQSTLVFSEEGYHQVYGDAYHWSNLSQLNGLQNNCCLMVGLSMSDPNLRRLLDISARNTERTSHYAFMKRLSNESFCNDDKDGKKIRIINNQKAAGEFLKRHHALNEELMKELGVKVIWYESYDDIPQILDKIR